MPHNSVVVAPFGALKWEAGERPARLRRRMGRRIVHVRKSEQPLVILGRPYNKDEARVGRPATIPSYHKVKL